jgi:hypothetical protein
MPQAMEQWIWETIPLLSYYLLVGTLEISQCLQWVDPSLLPYCLQSL